MVLNPEFLRLVRINLSPRRALFCAGLTVTLAIITMILVWSGTYPYERMFWDEKIRRFGQNTFGILFFAQFALIHVIATGAAGGSLVQERMRGTLIFQQMTLLSAREMLLGKLFGSTVLYYFIAAIIFPFAFVAATMSGMSLTTFAYYNALLVVGGLCWQLIALFVSTRFTASHENANRNLLGIGYGIGGVAGLFSISIFSAIWEMNDHFIHFYGWPVEAIPLILGIMGIVAIWAYIGAARAYKELQLMKLAPATVWAFFACLELLLVGLLWFYPDRYVSVRDGIWRTIIYLFINWMALATLVGSVTVNRNQLREWWSADQDALGMFRRAEIRDSVLTFIIAALISVSGFGLLWISFGKLDPRWNAEMHELSFTGAMYVKIATSFLLTLVAMAGFVQFWSMFRFRAASLAGVGMWVLLFIIMSVAAGVTNTKGALASMNFVIFAGESMDKPTNYSYMMGGLALQASFAVLCVGLAFMKLRRARRELLQN